MDLYCPVARFKEVCYNSSRRLKHKVRSVGFHYFLLSCMHMYEGACPHICVKVMGLHHISFLVAFYIFLFVLKTEPLTQPGAPCFS